MIDKELIAWWDGYVESMGSVMGEVEHMAQQMRNRIEALVKEQNYWIQRCGRERAFASSHRVRAERLEAAASAVADDVCSYICPSVGRAGEPILHDPCCIALRAALKGADHE